MISRISLAIVAAAACIWGQSRYKVDVNAESEDGKALQAALQEQDAAKRIAALEVFAGKHPGNPNILFVYGVLQPAFLKAGQSDKVFPLAEKLLAADAADAEMAHGALKAAEAKKDMDLVIKWAKITSESAAKAAVLPKPKDEDEEERWKYRVDFGKQVGKYAEYSVFAASIQATDPATKVKLMNAIGEVNPNSEYLATLDPVYFYAYLQMGDRAKALELAEKSSAKGTANEDMLLLLVTVAEERKDPAKLIEASQKLVDFLKAASPPQGADVAQWTKKKDSSLGIGYYMIGQTHAQAQRWMDSDANFREALPYLQGNDNLLGTALFNLGMANYRIGQGGPKSKPDMKRISDALKYNTQCAAIKGPNQAQAQKNLAVIRQQFPGVK